jgi:myo-inositol 2-dehydrogenase / D-chiro-inositol 1-dehydrogenase
MAERITTAGPLAVGVIGLGWIGEAHLTDLAARRDVQIVAVCDIVGDLVAATAARFGATGHMDPAAMLTEHRLDALWICTPPQHHLAPLRLAAARKTAIYLEKPIARDLADAREIAAIVAEHGVVCAVGYQWHALDLLDRIRAELAGQRVGYLLGRSIGPTATRPWFLSQAQSGGNLLERGSHQIDLVRAVAGEVVAVSAVASAVRLDRPERAGQDTSQDIDDALTVLLHLESGAIATIAIAWAPEGTPGTYSLELVASRGMLRLALDPDFRLTGTWGPGTIDVIASTTPFTASNSRFLAAVRAGDPTAVACTPENAMGTLRVALAGERALATGRRVTVS